MKIQVTDRAKSYLKTVGKPNVSLNVKGGGCSGFQYEWGVTDKEPTVENLWLDPMAEMFILDVQLTTLKNWEEVTSK